MRAVCTESRWQVRQPGPECDAPLLPPACPASPSAEGTPCSDLEARCWYDDATRCLCSPCAGGSGYPVCQTIEPPQWACAALGEGCPASAPQAGSACSTPGLNCGHDCELPIVCDAGVWKWGLESCPICAAADTPIATPSGERAIASLRAGDLVYSIEREAVVIAPILRTTSTPVRGHSMLRVVLDDGRVIEMSAGHPTAAGTPFALLQPGSALDERHTIASVTRVPYPGDRTYDILPATSGGQYFAAGALVGSTLAHPSRTADAECTR